MKGFDLPTADRIVRYIKPKRTGGIKANDGKGFPEKPRVLTSLIYLLDNCSETEIGKGGSGSIVGGGHKKVELGVVQ